MSQKDYQGVILQKPIAKQTAMKAIEEFDLTEFFEYHNNIILERAKEGEFYYTICLTKMYCGPRIPLELINKVKVEYEKAGYYVDNATNPRVLFLKWYN